MTTAIATPAEGSVKAVTLRRNQRTLNTMAACTGVGVHTGHRVTARFLPAPEGTGIVFRRTDLPNQPKVPAQVPFLLDTARSTIIGIGETRVHTVEHVLAAIRGYELDNLIVELSHDEPPILDGSSAPYTRLFEEAGVREQNAPALALEVTAPIHWSNGDVHLVALPYDGFKVSFTLHHPSAEALEYQYRSQEITRESFVNEIAPCRTFCFHKEIAFLQKQGLIKGGSLDNAVVFQGGTVISHEGLRFPDEPVRHKILDLIGDLFLLGCPLQAHVIAIRSGHAGNVAFAQKIHEILRQKDVK